MWKIHSTARRRLDQMSDDLMEIPRSKPHYKLVHKKMWEQMKDRAEKLEAALERMSGLYVRYFEMYQEHAERAEKAEHMARLWKQKSKQHRSAHLLHVELIRKKRSLIDTLAARSEKSEVENASLKEELSKCASEMRSQFVRAEKAESELDARRCCGNCAGWEDEKLVEGCAHLVRAIYASDVCPAWKAREK